MYDVHTKRSQEWLSELALLSNEKELIHLIPDFDNKIYVAIKQQIMSFMHK